MSPDHPGRDRAHRHARRAALGRAGRVRPRRAVDRRSSSSSRASTRCSVVAETFYAGLNDFTLVSIPMFVMMGAAIGSSPAGKDLYEALDRWLYRAARRAGDLQPRRLRDLRRAHRLLARVLRGDRQDGHSGDAQARLSGRDRHRLDLRRRHARHPDPAVDHVHPLRHRHRDLDRAPVPRRRDARA